MNFYNSRDSSWTGTAISIWRIFRKTYESAAYALDALKQSEDDVICRITDSSGNRDAAFLINENGSG